MLNKYTVSSGSNIIHFSISGNLIRIMCEEHGGDWSKQIELFINPAQAREIAAWFGAF
jgi:hypothetical protein